MKPFKNEEPQFFRKLRCGKVVRHRSVASRLGLPGAEYEKSRSGKGCFRPESNIQIFNFQFNRVINRVIRRLTEPCPASEWSCAVTYAAVCAMTRHPLFAHLYLRIQTRIKVYSEDSSTTQPDLFLKATKPRYPEPRPPSPSSSSLNRPNINQLPRSILHPPRIHNATNPHRAWIPNHARKKHELRLAPQIRLLALLLVFVSTTSDKSPPRLFLF